MKKDCKNIVPIPPTPCEYGGNCPPAPDCEQIFDLDCVNYTGDPIVCNGEVIVESGESLPVVLTTLVDTICNKTNCELDVQFDFNVGTSKLNFTITGGTQPYLIKPSVVQGPFTGISLSDCATFFFDGPNNCYNPVYSSSAGFNVGVSCVPNKFYVGNGSNKYAGTVRIELVDPFGCSHDFYYTVVIDEEDCNGLP